MKMLRVATFALALTLIATPASAIHEPPQPFNDTVATATVIDEMPFWTHGTTESAGDNTDDAAYPSCFGRSSSNVWYQYTATRDADVVLSVPHAGFDVALDVFEKDGENVACYDSPSSYGFDVTVPVVAGETYLIRVAGVDDDFGSFELAADEFPPMEATLTVADHGMFPISSPRPIVVATIECNQDGYIDVKFTGTQLTAKDWRSRVVECGQTFWVPLGSTFGEFLPGPMDVDWSGYACRGKPADSDGDATTMGHPQEAVRYTGCEELSGSKTVLLIPTR